MRLLYLDSMKGILIFLVILGHAIQFTSQEYEDNFMFKFIYSFHMPLFLMISGYLTYRKKHDNRMIAKRARQCLVPFIIWAFALPLLEGQIDLWRSWKILQYPDKGLWFLYHVFIYSAIFSISEGWSRKWGQELLVVIFVIACYIGMILFGTWFNFTQLCWHIPFFALGYYVHKYDNLPVFTPLWTVIWGGIYVMAFGCLNWEMALLPKMFGLSYLLKYMVELTGALFFYSRGRKFFNRRVYFVDEMGKMTLGIYAFQFVVLYWLGLVLDCNEILKIILEAFLCTIICFWIVRLLQKTKWIKAFVIGDFSDVIKK